MRRHLTRRQNNLILTASLTLMDACSICSNPYMNRCAPAQIRQGKCFLSIAAVLTAQHRIQRWVLFDLQHSAITPGPTYRRPCESKESDFPDTSIHTSLPFLISMSSPGFRGHCRHYLQAVHPTLLRLPSNPPPNTPSADFLTFVKRDIRCPNGSLAPKSTTWRILVATIREHAQSRRAASMNYRSVTERRDELPAQGTDQPVFVVAITDPGIQIARWYRNRAMA